MIQINSIANHNKNVMTYTEGGTCKDSHLVNAECTNGNLVYIGCTTEQLNKRLSGTSMMSDRITIV